MKYVWGFLWISLMFVAFEELIALNYGIKEPNKWIELGATFILVFGTMIYLRILKLLKTFKWDDTTRKWDEYIKK